MSALENIAWPELAKNCLQISAQIDADRKQEPYELVRALIPIRDQALSLHTVTRQRALIDFARGLDSLIDEFTGVDWNER